MLINARMYSVTPESRAAWRTIFDWVLQQASIDAQYEDHDPPKLLSDLWKRDDLACVMMCGLPFSLRRPQATILAAPIPQPALYRGLPIYWSDIAVAKGAHFQTLQDTFGFRAGYTLKDSQSGYVAFRHHLLRCFPTVPEPYPEVIGSLLNPRGVIEALVSGRIDVGPLDSYVHDLLKKTNPAYAAQVRVIERTEPTPIPPIVATAPLTSAAIDRIRKAFEAVHAEPELEKARDTLLIERFIVPEVSIYRVQRERAEELELGCPEWP